MQILVEMDLICSYDGSKDELDIMFDLKKTDDLLKYSINKTFNFLIE